MAACYRLVLSLVGTFRPSRVMAACSRLGRMILRRRRRPVWDGVYRPGYGLTVFPVGNTLREVYVPREERVRMVKRWVPEISDQNARLRGSANIREFRRIIQNEKDLKRRLLADNRRQGPLARSLRMTAAARNRNQEQRRAAARAGGRAQAVASPQSLLPEGDYG